MDLEVNNHEAGGAFLTNREQFAGCAGFSSQAFAMLYDGGAPIPQFFEGKMSTIILTCSSSCCVSFALASVDWCQHAA